MMVMWKLKPMPSSASSRRMDFHRSAPTSRSVPRTLLKSRTIIRLSLFCGEARGRGDMRGDGALEDVETLRQNFLLDGQRCQDLDHLVMSAGGLDDEAALETFRADRGREFTR